MTSRDGLPYDIAVVGLGIVGTHQITREAEEIVRRCRRTFVIDTAIGVVGYLRTLSPAVTSLASTYTPGTHRRLIYRNMASTVVATALEDAPVCFATYGHPKIYCHPTTLIQRAAKVLNLKTAVFPAVSSIDILFSEINVDPGFDGLQMYDATDLVVRRRPLQTDVSCVILQAPTVLQPYNKPGLPNLDDLTLLQNYILEFYPAEHRAILVTSKTHPLLETIRVQVTLGKLALALQQSAAFATLFIPPVQHREIADQELADRVRLRSKNESASPAIARRPDRPTIGPTLPTTV